jgi:choline dehydrogenase-like flavoprotein
MQTKAHDFLQSNSEAPKGPDGLAPRDFWLHDTISALSYSIGKSHARPTEALDLPYNDLTQFILFQQNQLPDFLRMPMEMLTRGFDLAGILRTGALFHSGSEATRAKQIAAWKKSKISFKRDLIRYYESLATFALYSRGSLNANRPSPEYSTVPAVENETNESKLPEFLQSEIVVVGSGPGGAITACLLAESGREVLLLEEGSYHAPGAIMPFSLDEMLQKYRNGGQTVALGKSKIAYVEGRCVGGGSEINSGLYHRTPDEILERWRSDFNVQGLTSKELLPHFLANEKELSVSSLPGPGPAASLKLEQGAACLGWKSLEVPRWVRYDGSNNTSGARQTMTRTFIPRFLKAGGRLADRSRVIRIFREGDRWILEVRRANGTRIRIAARTLFLCAGATQTPALLCRSGISKNVGNSLQLHPTLKLAAQFSDPVNFKEMGVPAHQVKEFAPGITFGCSVSTLPYLALGLLEHSISSMGLNENWPNIANYYAMIAGEGRGSVRILPGYCDPLVRYTLTVNDRRALADGARKLATLLFEAGAKTVWLALPGTKPLLNSDDIKEVPTVLPNNVSGLMTIHLFSSCPMGEDKSKCAVDSFGKVHGPKNLFVADASILCSAPGVNPQGTLMALARRNALHFIESRR